MVLRARALWAVEPWARTDWRALLETERAGLAPWLAVAMTAGAALYFAWLSEPAFYAGPAAIAAGIAASAATWRSIWRGAALAGLAVALGFSAGQAATWRAAALMEVPNRAVVVTGTVAAVEAVGETGRRVTLSHPVLATGDEPGKGFARDVRLRLRDTDPGTVATGDTVRVRALLRKPSPPAYPGAWDLRRDAFFANLGAYGFALGPVAVLEHAEPGGAARMLQSMRETIAARVGAVLSGPEAGIATALLTGEAGGIPLATKAAFRDSGLSHLLAIAGLHIGIVMGLLFGATRFALACWERAALRWPCKAIAAATALLGGAGYMLLTGGHVPIIRSFAMACLVTLGVLAGRRVASLRGLALAMATIVLIAPSEVMGVSFQLSFSAVLALIAGYAALRPALTRLRGRPWVGHVAALALTSALAGTASAPFAAYHFGRMQIYFVLANMLAVPLTAFWVMPLGLLALLLMPLHLEAAALIPMGLGETGLIAIGQWVSGLPDAVLAVPRGPAWGIVSVAFGLAWLGISRTRLRLLGVLPIAAGVLAPWLVVPPDALVSADGRLIAVLRTDGTVALQARGSVDKFTRDAWATMWGVAGVGPMPDDCGSAGCRVPVAGGTLFVANGPPPRDSCDADAVVSAEPVRLRCDVPVVDRFSVWREGAAALWVGSDGAVVVTSRGLTGTRPWSPVAVAAHTATTLPMATVDEGTD